MPATVTHEQGPYHVDDDGRTVYMAKVIAGAGPNDTVVFLNGDPLDCRRANLKVVKGPTVARPRVGGGRRGRR